MQIKARWVGGDQELGFRTNGWYVLTIQRNTIIQIQTNEPDPPTLPIEVGSLERFLYNFADLQKLRQHMGLK